MRERLSPYQLVVSYVEGKTHYIADALSRAPFFEPTDSPAINAANVLIQQSTDPAFLEIIKDVDYDYQQIIDALLKDYQPKNLADTHPAKPFKSVWHEISILDCPAGKLLVFDGSRIIPPTKARTKLLKRLHMTHAGINRTQQLAKQAYFWPGMNSDIKNLITNCTSCLKWSPKQQHSHSTVQLPSDAGEPMTILSIDYFHWGGKPWISMIAGSPVFYGLSKPKMKAATRYINGSCQFLTHLDGLSLLDLTGDPSFNHFLKTFAKNLT